MPEVASILDDRDDCADEPIHIPGSIQPHGYLFVLNAADLTIVAASQNAAEMLGVKPMELVGRRIADLLVSSTEEDPENPLNSQSKITRGSK